jgi:hypothetical protein
MRETFWTSFDREPIWLASQPDLTIWSGPFVAAVGGTARGGPPLDAERGRLTPSVGAVQSATILAGGRGPVCRRLTSRFSKSNQNGAPNPMATVEIAQPTSITESVHVSAPT